MLFLETPNEYNVLAKSLTLGISISKLPTSDKENSFLKPRK